MTTTPFARAPGRPRDPARIDIVLAALRAYWTANPDLRLGQIVVNAAGGGDPFSVEDEVLMAAWPKQNPEPGDCRTCRFAIKLSGGEAGCDHPERDSDGAWDKGRVPPTFAWSREHLADDEMTRLPGSPPCPGHEDCP